MNVSRMYCNNCGGQGHVFKTCKDPITSCGLLLLRGPHEPLKLPIDPKVVSVLMVRRKDSMSYMEFIRGKYDPTDTNYLKTMFSNMTADEQAILVKEDFDTLWTKLWGQGRDTKSMEYEIAKENYNTLDRETLVASYPSKYLEPEWGFPKGRRSKGESDLECAMREFFEETNVPPDAYEVLKDVWFTETFRATNNTMYRHIYAVAVLKDSSVFNLSQKLTSTQKREVSAVAWKTLKQAKEITRPHYVERKTMIGEIERAVATYQSI
jgi:8-oxo-dGTP pyrophosphatase MutT (NUDIX family)